MSYFTQMAGLAYHNFVSAAVGISVAIAFIRGIAQKETDTIGNFWVDLVRASLWVLLPISIAGALFLVSQGVVQNLKPYDKVAVLDPQTVTTTGADGKPQSQKVTEQTIAQGPIASQEIIKQFGTNGGGFLNANSAHPFENPTPLSNFVAMFGIFAISSGLTYTLGSMTGSRRHGWAVWSAMAFLFLAGVTVAYWAEARGNPLLTTSGADQTTTATSPGGNMEGKEVRFGIANTALFATATTDASCGAINGWHDSFTPLGGLVPLANIELSEVVFGGVGAGLYGILVYIILSVFIAGLMVGRTPEYLGKKIQAFEVQMAMLTVLIFSLLILAFTATSSVSPAFGTSGIFNPGPHGLSEMLYAVLIGRREQRLRLWGHQREHALVQHDARPDDAVRAVLHDHSAARHRRQPGAQEEGARVARDVPRHDAAFRRAARRRHRHRRGADVLPGVEPGPDCRALHDECGAGVLMAAQAKSIWDPQIVRRAIGDAFRKLHPRTMARNPVMFVVEIGSVLTTIRLVRDAAGGGSGLGFELQITFWLWLTVIFANFAEAMAEGRGKAQADALRRAKTETVAQRERADRSYETVPAPALRKGDVVRVQAGEVIPADGDIIEGVASVDESAITGESAPVIRESGGDRSAVTGGTKVLSDWIRVKVTVNPGETFLDRMIALVEGAERQKTPNEIALNILLAGLTIVFLIAVVTLQPFAIYSGAPQSLFVLVSLLVCLIPTTIGGLLSAIGIAGMDRLVQHNVLAMSGRAVEAAGDVHTLLLDKTGTITLGNRQAAEFIPLPGISEASLADAAQLASLPDETPEGRSIVVLAKEKYGLRGRELSPQQATFVAFTAQTRMSGVDLHVQRRALVGAGAPAANGDADVREIRKGAADAIEKWVVSRGGMVPEQLVGIVQRIARAGGTPLVVAEGRHALGVIHLKDIVKGGIRDRFAHLRAMGIKTVMITGDNPLTAAAIASEAGVDDFLAQATPEDKMALIKREQARRKARRDDRRRHQRRPRARAGRRRRGDEHRHAGGEGSRQHGRSRLEPDEADRGRGDRQAAAHHPRRPDDVLDCQRRGEVLRDHSGDVPRDVPAARRTQHHGSAHAAVGDPVGGDLQRAHHRRAGAARASGHQVSAGRRCGAAEAQPADLRGRRRDHPVHRDQGHRRRHHGPSTCVGLRS